MQGFDFSQIEQKGQTQSDQPHMNTCHFDLPDIQNIKNYEIQEAELNIQLQDDPFHSYRVEKKHSFFDLNSFFDNPQTFNKQAFEDPKLEVNEQILLGDTDACLLQESSTLKTKKQKEIKLNHEGKEYAKNIVAYASKKTIKLMFDNHQRYLSKKCKILGINFRQFKKIYKSFEKIASGPENLKKIFDYDVHNEAQVKMKKLFTHTFVKILRRDYLIYTLKLGKMRQHKPYIEKKNKVLLYFPFRDQML